MPNITSMNISCFSLKEDKTIGDNTISTNEQLYEVDICKKTGMINVCSFDGKYYTYFWVNPEEIISVNTSVKHFDINDEKIHIKAIKEEWIIKKNTKKELKQKKNKQK